jgi:hypothetical protein
VLCTYFNLQGIIGRNDTFSSIQPTSPQIISAICLSDNSNPIPPFSIPEQQIHRLLACVDRIMPNSPCCSTHAVGGSGGGTCQLKGDLLLAIHVFKESRGTKRRVLTLSEAHPPLSMPPNDGLQNLETDYLPMVALSVVGVYLGVGSFESKMGGEFERVSCSISL